MAETKYGKYFLTEPRLRTETIRSNIVKPKAVLQSGPHFGAGNFTMSWQCVTQPMVMDPISHSHNFDEYLAFMGSNAENVFDFDAEIEVFMGEEGERHTIDKATVLYIPAGLVHCPFIFHRVAKPILFDIIAFHPSYWDEMFTSKDYFVREGRYAKTITDLKELIKENTNPAATESYKALLKKLENNKDLKQLF